jgi:hypothetical protein
MFAALKCTQILVKASKEKGEIVSIISTLISGRLVACNENRLYQIKIDAERCRRIRYVTKMNIF